MSTRAPPTDGPRINRGPSVATGRPYAVPSSAACAAARRAIGTRYGEHDT